MSDDTKKLTEYVAAMILKGDLEDEVRDWLRTKKGLAGPKADKIIEEGFRRRRRGIRIRAVLRAVFAGIGVALFAIFLFLQYAGQFVLVGGPVLIAWGLGVCRTENTRR